MINNEFCDGELAKAITLNEDLASEISGLGGSVKEDIANILNKLKEGLLVKPKPQNIRDRLSAILKRDREEIGEKNEKRWEGTRFQEEVA